MKTKNIVILISSALLLALGGWLIASTAKNAGGPASIKAPETILLDTAEKEFDFGEISMAEGNVSRLFAIENVSQSSVKVGKIYTSCMCTSATFIKDGKRVGPFGMVGHGFAPKVNQVLNAGEKAEVEVVFDPAAHGPAGIGPIERNVIVESENGRPLELTIRALVKP